MKNTFKLIALLLLGISVVFFIGCEDDDDDEYVANELAGTWTMNDMSQTALYTAATDIAAIGIVAGDTLGGGTVPWVAFQAMGVSATVVLTDEDDVLSFTLTGYLPLGNDTLGFNPNVVPLPDAGSWSTNADLTHFTLTGDYFGMDGDLVYDATAVPATFTVSYSEVEVDTVVLPVDASDPPDGIPDMFLPDIQINAMSSTTLGFESAD